MEFEGYLVGYFISDKKISCKPNILNKSKCESWTQLTSHYFYLISFQNVFLYSAKTVNNFLKLDKYKDHYLISLKKIALQIRKIWICKIIGN